jgi:4-hydroxy-tetrahydrodipicolinate reductase
MQLSSDASATSIIVHGAAGRMGARICALAGADPSFTLIAALTRGAPVALPPPGGPSRHEILPGKQGVSGGSPRADVVIDFSSDQGALAAIDIAARAGAALLVGTTGLPDSTIAALQKFSTNRAVIVAPNTSLGVAALADAVVRTARLLGNAYEISIFEAHHSRKKDAPSGTALRLARAAESAGARIRPDQIVAMRGGDVIGEHTVRFAGPGEYLELTHRATSRDVFARGALRTAAWLRGRAPGWYTMEDVLGLPRS